jgi:hypothetical protein
MPVDTLGRDKAGRTNDTVADLRDTRIELASALKTLLRLSGESTRNYLDAALDAVERADAEIVLELRAIADETGSFAALDAAA